MIDFIQKYFPVLALQQRKTSLFLIALICITVSGCSVFDREEDIPAYLYIDSFELTTKSDNSQGSNAHDILDAWVYVNGQLIGAFEVPAMVPVLEKDTARVTILAGIKKNGRSDDREIYPFYQGVQDTMILVPGKIDSIFPSLTYHDSTTFVWIEDFEDRAISFEPSGTNVEEDSMHLTFDPNEVFEHSAQSQVSAYVEFDSADQKFENATISKFTIPGNSSAYLELNYNLETSMQVGFYAYDQSGTQIDRIPVLILFPTNDVWKKSYVSFNEDISNPRFENATFRVFLEAYGPDDNPNGRIYIDNLKLVHF
ncbi:MAG: hypothetical protein JJ975_17740 [Bacteroidia bacterium]|nr:hypothetical protein [Bacteroidia bacterium]